MNRTPLPNRKHLQYQHAALALLALLVLLVACSSNTPPPAATPLPTDSNLPAIVTDTPAPEMTVGPVPTPGDVDALLGTLRQAFQAGDASSLKPLMLDAVFLAQGLNADNPQTLKRDDMVRWLNGHWGSGLTISAVNYNAEFEGLEVSTQDWATAQPLNSGMLVFHFHRYNAKGEGDALSGKWMIDTILYP